MRTRFFILLSLTLVVILFAFGCDDRGTNAPERFAASGGLFPLGNTPIATPALNFQIRNREGLLQTAWYIPGTKFPLANKLPLLVLLAPENEGKFFYSDHGLADLAEELIETGQIEPMIIVMVGNDGVFGGYFYGNSPGAGMYDSIFGSAMFDWVSNKILDGLLDDPRKRGIGGIGQGAYGALRAAITHPGFFGSVSVADGPIDFDGSGTGGLIPLFQDVFTELGVRSGIESFFTDPTIFDTLFGGPVTEFFIGGSMAFSPHDTAITWNVDTLLFDTIRDPITNKLDTIILDLDYPITSRTVITDSTTLIDHVILPPGLVQIDPSRNDFNFDFHLPFDVYGNPYAPIWSLWMRNNIDSLNAQFGDPLGAMNIWVGRGSQATFGPWKSYNDQVTSFLNTFNTVGYNVTQYDYQGYEGNPATRDEYIYDLMREMLIFHSNSFRQ